MAKLLQLLNEWEIQLLVLFSFTFQVFLFFTGGLRQRTTSKFINLVIWMAYLGADFVAVYALGFLSRHEDATTGRDTLMGTHQLAFFWAPFLLIHLGGQDTITAFAIEDNNLWLRHLLTLVVQATLALYVFWKSTSGPSMQLIVPSILLFVTGTIKYGERIWALRCGSLGSPNSSESSIARYYPTRPIESDASYSDIISRALFSIPVRDFFAGFGWDEFRLTEKRAVHPDKLPKLLEIELGLMYDNIYTKATVIRTRGGIILRCISQISFVAAFVLFFVSNNQRYNSVDTAITYALFMGGFSLEVCAIFITMMSPWTCAWLLKLRDPNGLSRFLLSINIRWQRKRQLWSYSMGQYSLMNFLGQNDQLQSGLWKRYVMVAIRKVVNQKPRTTKLLSQKFWISKLLDTKFVEVDKEIMECVVRWIVQYRPAESSPAESSMGRQLPSSPAKSSMGRQLPTVIPVWKMRSPELPNTEGFENAIVRMHAYTELILSRCSGTGVDGESAAHVSARMCRKISNYMVYLLVTHPELLPVTRPELLRVEPKPWEVLGLLYASIIAGCDFRGRDDVIQRIQRAATTLLGHLGREVPIPDCTEAHLLEIQEAWIGILIYLAGKSRPEAHAAQLARGGELFTFVWLLMAHHMLGDVGNRIELAEFFHVEGEAIHPHHLFCNNHPQQLLYDTESDYHAEGETTHHQPLSDTERD